MRLQSTAWGALATLCTSGCMTGDIGGNPSNRATHDGGTTVPGPDGATPGPPETGTADSPVPAEHDGGATEVGPPVSTTPTGAWSMGYYVGYQRDLYPVANIEWSGLTHLAVSFYLVSGDGTLDERLFVDETAGPALAHALVDAAHAHGVKAIASIGGAGSGAALKSATSTATRGKFVDNLVSILTKYHYDGLDIDWEPLDASDRMAAIAIADEVRAKHPGTIMTMPINYLNGNSHDDLKGFGAVAAVYDELNVMSYGMAGAYPGWKSWHSSALHYADGATPTSIESTIALYLAAGIPNKRLGVGIGFYGLCYSSPISAPVQDLGGAKINADDNTMSFTNIMASYHSAADRKWDALAAVPYLSFGAPHGPSNCTFVSYEDEQSIAEKGVYLKAQGLGGVIVWTINQGPVGGKSPLLEAIRDHVMH
jgi:chitinase